MNVTVLLSAGRHPVSGAPVLPTVEAQAIRLAESIGTQPIGLHAGVTPNPASDALGCGLARVIHLRVEPDADPVPALIAALEDGEPDLVLAGRRGQGGEETGLVPYRLAHALGWTLIPDAIAIAAGAEPGTLVVDQALPKGARRRLTVRLPAIVTVHNSAPPPRPFAYGQAKRGRIETVTPSRLRPSAAPCLDVEERPYRARPKQIGSATAGASAAERLKMATGGADMTGGGGPNVLINPSPEVAAREILAYFRRIGVLPYPTAGFHKDDNVERNDADIR